MINIIKNYGAVIFLVNAILIEYSLNLSFIHEWISYMLCGFGIVLLMFFPKFLFSSFGYINFRFIFYYIIINFIYLITFGIETLSTANVFYFLAKSGSLILIVSGIINSPIYFNGKFLNYFISFIGVLLIFGLLFNKIDTNSGRMTLGFNNSNLMGMLAAICFGIVLLKEKKINKKNFIYATFFILVILLSGSRSSFLVIILASLFKYNFKIGYYLLGLLMLISISQFSEALIGSSAATRLFEQTFDAKGEIITGRENEFDFALVRLKSKLWTGNGFISYKNFDSNDYHYFSDKKINGSHNAYLTIAIMYGIFFGGILIFMMFKTTFRGFKRYFKYDSKFTVYVFITSSILLIGMAEDLIVGINQAVSYLFFISISIIGVGINNQNQKKYIE